MRLYHFSTVALLALVLLLLSETAEAVGPEGSSSGRTGRFSFLSKLRKPPQPPIKTVLDQIAPVLTQEQYDEFKRRWNHGVQHGYIDQISGRPLKTDGARGEEEKEFVEALSRDLDPFLDSAAKNLPNVPK